MLCLVLYHVLSVFCSLAVYPELSNSGQIKFSLPLTPPITYVSQVCRLSSAGILNTLVLGHLVGQAGFSLVFSENLSLTYLILQSDEGVLAMPHGLYDETAY